MSSTIVDIHADQRPARAVGRKALTMRRHMLRCISMLAACLFLVPLASDAQPLGQIRRVGILTAVTAPTLEPLQELLRQGLHERGYVEGQNIALELRSSEGRPERLPDLAGELVRLKVDVILAQSNPAIAAAQKVTTSIPIF